MTAPSFDRYIILCNPISTDAYKAEGRIGELRQLFPTAEIIVIETRPGGREANADLVREYADKLGPQTLLCIAAGDGTINMVIDVLLRDPSLPPKAYQTPILPLWCGNANDLAHMLNGRSSRITMKTLLQAGQIVAIRPLSCRLSGANGRRQTYLGACYVSFGASAFAAQELERTMRKRSPMRQAAVSRIGQEIIAVSRALLRAPTFAIDDSGQTKVIFERIFLNGSRFAKVTGVPLRLTDERFHRATIERKSFAAIMFHIAEITRDRTGSRVSATHDAFTVHDSVWAQFDGEAVRIPGDTQVEVTISDRPFYALSVRFASH